jgi:uncharacterized protein (TIGR03118 family)
MSGIRLNLALAASIGASLLGIINVGIGREDAQSADHGINAPTVLVTDLVADISPLKDAFGVVHRAAVVDPNLVNPWGVSESLGPSGSPFWVSANGQSVSALYTSAGDIVPLVVSVPAPGDPLNSSGSPTGTVFNAAVAFNGFEISGVDKNGNPISAPAVFLTATEDGTIVGWNPNVNPLGFDPSKVGTYGVIAVDNSENPNVASGAVYKGLAIVRDATGNTLLYATNFRAGTVEVYDSAFNPVTPSPNAFTDPKLPPHYAPFNIVAAGGVLYVTYAQQDKARRDDVAGGGHGFVDTFNLSGQLIARFAEHGQLNSPWGLVQAPASFGSFAGDIFIGNFGDGHINAFDPNTGNFLGTVTDAKGQVIQIDGLWSLLTGNGAGGGDLNTIYFTSGPDKEQHGLFGSISATAPVASTGASPSSANSGKSGGNGNGNSGGGNSGNGKSDSGKPDNGKPDNGKPDKGKSGNGDSDDDNSGDGDSDGGGGSGGHGR